MRQGGQVEQPKQIRLSGRGFSFSLSICLSLYGSPSLSFCHLWNHPPTPLQKTQIVVVVVFCAPNPFFCLCFAQVVAAFQYDPKVQIYFNLIEFGPTFICSRICPIFELEFCAVQSVKLFKILSENLFSLSADCRFVESDCISL